MSLGWDVVLVCEGRAEEIGAGISHMVINEVGNHLEYICKYYFIHPSIPS